MPTLPLVEIFSDINTNGLFRIYVDTYTFTTDGGETSAPLTHTSTTTDFTKKVAAKIRSNFISLLKSVSNSRSANLPQDLLDKLFDETGSRYLNPSDPYTKSVYGLLASNNVMIATFYNMVDPITTKPSDIDCNIAYFTFKMQFKYKLLDYVIQVDIGHGIYSDTNVYTGDDVTVTGDLTVNRDLTVTGNSTLASVSSSVQATLHKLIVSGTSQFNNPITVGDATCSHDVKIHGGDGSDEKYLEWDASAFLLNLRGGLVIGATDSGDVGTDNDDSNDVTIYGQNGKLDWIAATDTLDLKGVLHAQQDATILGDVTIGSGTDGSSLVVHGTDSSGMSIDWNNTTANKLILKGELDIGTATAGHFVNIYSHHTTKYIKWDPANYKLQINANSVVIGDECNSSTLKIWGTDTGKCIDWNTVANKLQIIGDVELDAVHSLTLNGTYSAAAITCAWDGPTGTLTNGGKTVLSLTEISTSLICGSAATGCNFTTHGADGTGNKIDWSKTTNTFTITGLLTVSGNATLAGPLITNNDVTMKSNAPGKEVKWTHATNTLQVTGIINLNGAVTINASGGVVTVNSDIYLSNPVQINENVKIGENENGHLFKAYGDSLLHHY